MRTLNNIIVLVLFVLCQSVVSQIKINSFESLEDAMKIDPKPVVIFIHTDWCIYCKNMESTTFKNNEIIQKLNTAFYFITLNAENRETINFLDNDFRFNSNGHKTGIHQLAKELAVINNKIAYPTLTILNKEYEIIFQKQSFLSANQLLKILEKIS
ncbi:thioredoxin fold domain-containing protein [Aquimarina sp. I32.4]|uniref:thioredoxin family protein n=1 Tax=Aquimarina sp. I32.4 TaxID=2053903 RepID=UPI000CDEAB79|nr:thioredoxin fold domain-containing protein [Aquimarina sp. I32.4]